MLDADTVRVALAPYDKIALAVSGGSDSTALMLLVSNWHGKVTILTVDHQLRPDSRKDAEQTRQWANRLGLDCEILTWQHDEPTSRIQEKARLARYGLMTDWCRENAVPALVTAHTRNDQLETFAMRLNRASGVKGLGAMAPKSSMNSIDIIRPLLDVSRQELQDYLKANYHGWLDDPSNYNRVFERVRIRQDKPFLPDGKIIALTAKRLRRANEALEMETSNKMAQLVKASTAGYCLIEREGFDSLADEFSLRILQRCIEWAGGGCEYLSMAAIEQLGKWASNEQGSARTLGGTRITRRKDHFVIGREAGRISSKIEIASSGTAIWDGRFEITNNSAKIVTIAKTGNNAPRPDSSNLPHLPHFVHCALPAVYKNAQLQHIPFYQSTGDIEVKILKLPENVPMDADLSS